MSEVKSRSVYFSSPL